MNERLRLLAKQAGFYFYDLHDIDGQDLGETIEADKWSAAEKFAELLLREAIDIIEKAPTQHCAYTTYDKTVVDCTVQKIITALHSEFELTKIYKAPQ